MPLTNFCGFWRFWVWFMAQDVCWLPISQTISLILGCCRSAKGEFWLWKGLGTLPRLQYASLGGSLLAVIVQQCMPDLCLGQRRGNVCCTCKSINQCHEMRDHLLLLRGVHACFLTVVLRMSRRCHLRHCEPTGHRYCLATVSGSSPALKGPTNIAANQWRMKSGRVLVQCHLSLTRLALLVILICHPLGPLGACTIAGSLLSCVMLKDWLLWCCGAAYLLEEKEVVL